ncbi:MAG: GAF domain-containing protein, partial [Pseudomonadota bacterium]
MADAGALDLSDLHERLLHVMREDLGLDACCVTLLTDDGNNLHHTVLFAARASDDDPADSSLKGAVGEPDTLYTARDPATFASQVIATGAPLVIDDMHKLTNGGHCPLMAAEGFCAYLGAPITPGFRRPRRSRGFIAGAADLVAGKQKEDAILCPDIERAVGGSHDGPASSPGRAGNRLTPGARAGTTR